MLLPGCQVNSISGQQHNSAIQIVPRDRDGLERFAQLRAHEQRVPISVITCEPFTCTIPFYCSIGQDSDPSKASVNLQWLVNPAQIWRNEN